MIVSEQTKYGIKPISTYKRTLDCALRTNNCANKHKYANH